MSNGTLDLKPLEVKDFSGGMTDYYFQGNSNRYEKADNFLISVDKMLERRPGSTGFDLSGNHRLPGPQGRITGFLLFENEQELLVNQGRDIYYLADTWTRMTGPDGSEVMGAGSLYSALSSAEWKGHTYLTNDAGPIPSKFYKDDTGAYQVRTVGLPKPVSPAAYTTSTLLVACITLANDLRASMVAHMNDYAGVAPSAEPQPGFLHAVPDKYSLSYFSAQTWSVIDDEYPGPTPTPTPAPAATDEASLYALVEAMCLAYDHHGNDPDSPYYHFEVYIQKGSAGGLGGTEPPKGPYEKVANNARPTDLETAALQLNELRQKWYWHRWGLYTHSADNNVALNSRHEVTAPAITVLDTLGTIDTIGVPTFTANYGDVLRYVNYLKNVYNLHVTNGLLGADWYGTDSYQGFHSQLNNAQFDQFCYVPDATDLDSAYLLIYTIWAMYGEMHVIDADWPIHRNITMDQTASSANVTDVKLQRTSAADTMPIDSWVWQGNNSAFNDTDSNNRYSARVTASGSGTATLSKTLISTVGDKLTQYSNSWYHVSAASTSYPGNLVLASDTTTFAAPTDTYLDPAPQAGLNTPIPLPPSLAAWVSRATEVWTALSNHIGNSEAHGLTYAVSNWTQGNGPFFTPEISEYSYAFVYDYKYTTETGTEFENRSAPIYVGPIETSSIFPLYTQRPTPETTDTDQGRVEEVSSVGIGNLPVLANTANTNYMTSEVTVEIYRTLNGGNTYYLLDEVDNGTLTYTDNTSDTLDAPGNDRLDTREELYTTGGVVENTQPPKSRFLHILNNTGYYGYIQDGSQTFKGRIIQSIPGSPDTGPSTFYDDIEDELTGLTSARSNLLAMGLHSIYRMQGGFTNLGQGALTHERISDTTGCVGVNSIVQTEVGVFFAGNDGFYYTDGFQLIKVSLDLDISYAQRTQTAAQCQKIYGTYDKLNRRIWWTMQTEPSGTECDSFFIFYLNYGVKPSGVFTTASGIGWQPTASVFYKRKLIRADAMGYIFKHDYTYHSDPELPDPSTEGSYDLDFADWNTVRVPYQYRSCALDFGTIAVGQWVTKIHMVGTNMGNAAMQFYSISDNVNDERGRKPIAPIYYRDNLMWGDPTVLWGDSGVIWRYDGKLDFWRRFSAKTLRSQLKQVELVPAELAVYRSEDYGNAQCIVDYNFGTVYLISPSGYSQVQWPGDLIQNVEPYNRLCLSADSYAHEAEIDYYGTDDHKILVMRDLDFGYYIPARDPNYTLLDSFFGEASADSGIDRNVYGDVELDGNGMTLTGGYFTYGTADNAAPLFTAITAEEYSLRFFYMPSYTTHATASQTIIWFGHSEADADTNSFRLIHNVAGALQVKIGAASSAVQTFNLGLWAPVAGKRYLIEVNVSAEDGFICLYIDGLKFKSVAYTSTGVDFSANTSFWVGSQPTPTGPSEFAIDDLLLFQDVAHTPTQGFILNNWVIRGYQKEASVGLSSYVLHYASLGMRGRAYQGKGDRGENVNG